MNDRIKEKIPFNVRDVLEDINSNILWNYITNLQNRITELEEINKQHQELNRELRKENKELKEYKENATRKHWQQKCAEHCINEKLLQARINKAIEYIKENACWDMICHDDLNYDECDDLLNILQDKEIK